MTTWFTIEGDSPEAAAAAQERLLAAWADAPLVNLEVCGMVLDVAREQVITYAPAGSIEQQLVERLTRLEFTDEQIGLALLALDLDPEAETDPPARYVYAQLQQATNLWNAGRVSSDGNMGDGSYTFTPRPLDKTIRGIIRPIDGKPDVY